MAEIDLKAYTNRAKELETAIYTQNMLMERHKKIMHQNKPVPPRNGSLDVNRPEKPNHSDYVNTPPSNFGGLAVALVFIVGGVIIVCMSINHMSRRGIDFSSFILMIIFGLMAVLGLCFLKMFISENKYREARQKQSGQAYMKAVREYEQKMMLYNNELVKAENDYAAQKVKYEGALRKYNENVNTMNKKHAEVLLSLEKALEELYSENVVFPKYRNIVAITTINEYLESGRCYELEGPNGAYNLYEMELRQNIVIGQLSTIVNNLEQIRSNQFSLYEELKKSSRKVDEIIYEIRNLNNTSKLNAYFNYVTAVAETSPKIYHGISY